MRPSHALLLALASLSCAHVAFSFSLAVSYTATRFSFPSHTLLRAREQRGTQALQAVGANAINTSDNRRELLQRATQSIGYRVAQAVVLVASLAVIDAGLSGDWVRTGVITTDVETVCRTAAYAILGSRPLLAAAAAVTAASKDLEWAPAAALTALLGSNEFLRITLLDNKETADGKSAALQPPLSMMIHSLDHELSMSPTGVLLSYTIRVNKGDEFRMVTRLRELVQRTKAEQSQLVLTITANQDPEDRCNFLLLERFPSLQAMRDHQNNPVFKSFTTSIEDLLEEPIGLYMANERHGKLSESNYPFGPGGEGGRDDALYSSPANLDGSQGGRF